MVNEIIFNGNDGGHQGAINWWDAKLEAWTKRLDELEPLAMLYDV